MTAPFVSPEEVKSYLPIRSGNFEFDERLSKLIATASKQIETVTNRSFARATYTQTFDTIRSPRSFYDFGATSNETGMIRTPRTQMFSLRGYPAVPEGAITVNYDPTGLFNASTEVPRGVWLVNEAVNALILRAETGDHQQSLKVIYEAGYEVGSDDTLSDSIPADLKLACIVQVVHLFNRTQPDNIGVDTSRGEGAAATARWTSLSGLTPEVVGMVKHYKALAIGKG